MDHFIKCMTKKFAVFSGRASKREYWMFFLFVMISYAIAILIDYGTDTWDHQENIGLVSAILIFVFLVPYIAVTARRFHDINKSGWFLLISLIPVIGTIIILVMVIEKGTLGKNRFGEYPLKFKKGK